MKYRSTVLLVILAFVASAFLAACKRAPAPEPTQAPTAEATQTPTLTPTAQPPSTNPLDAFAKAQAALTGAQSVKLTVNTTKNGKTDTTVMEATTGGLIR